MKSYKIMRLPNGYNFKETNTQLIYEHFDGTNISTIARWKVGLECNIENIRRLLALIESKLINSELICLSSIKASNPLMFSILHSNPTFHLANIKFSIFDELITLCLHPLGI